MNGLFDRLIRVAIEGRHAVLVLALLFVVAGLWQLPRTKLDALPAFTPPMVTVQAEAPGYGSTEVETLLASPLERALQGIPGLAHLRSTSSPGLAVVTLIFDDETDIFRARQLVSERLQQAADRLPSNLPRPELAPIVSPVGALLRFTYTSAGDDPAAFAELSDFVSWRVAPALEAIEGVARVTVHGARTPRIEIQPQAESMLARGISLERLQSRLAGAQGPAPPGYVEAGPQRISLRAHARWTLRDLDQIASTVLGDDDGIPVRVSDVATVTLGATPPVGEAIQDGHRAIYLQVDKLPWADTLDLTRQVERTLARLDASLPPGCHRNPPVFRQADFIRTSLWSVGRAMLLGALLVVLTLLAFLRSPRVAAVSLVALPLSILAALAVLLLRGATVNGMILGGLTIAVGEVVDDAIVDAENIWRRLRENASFDPPRPTLQVIHDASVEVRGAVVYASLIIVAVLLPILLMGGLAGRIFAPLAESYALAILASLGVALTVTPALSAFLLGRAEASTLAESALSRRLSRAYASVLRWVHKRPGRVLISTLAVSLLSLGTLPFLGGAFLPEFREGVLIAEVDAWPGTSLAETTRLARRIDALLRAQGGIPHVAARIGRASLDEDAAPVHRMEMDIDLPDDGEEPEEAAAPLLALFAGVPGIRFALDGFLGERINELLAGERAPLAIKLAGPDLETLRRLASRFVDVLGRLPGVDRIRCRDLVDVPTREFVPDHAALALAGAAPADVADALAVHRQGLPVTQVTGPAGTGIPVVVHARTSGADAVHGEIPVWTARRGPVPLSTLARAATTSEPTAIRHEDGEPTVTVTLWTPPEDVTAVANRVREALGQVRVPEGVRWRMVGQAAERTRASVRLLLVASGVFIAIFVFLWLAFRSPIDAMVVLLGLPVGLAGGLVAALFLPDGLSLASLVGFVTLTGIISRNGIMLVAHKNDLLAARPGADPAAVIVQAAQERLRPILMTAATALGGLLPLALSIEAAGAELEAPMAIIVCGGLLTSTTLNLLAVPAFYLWRLRHAARDVP
ncbi:MAG: efflux RND transporter permease subunit [Deltaproteobacteria bacterium]|nr:MAG: efflux RND transporter permease subunit [Deltaproteobacteria bacterium]